MISEGKSTTLWASFDFLLLITWNLFEYIHKREWLKMQYFKL